MQANLARVASTYQQVQVTSRSPLELVVMLYDGALASLTKARDALQRRNLPEKAAATSRALAIVNELQSTLNLEAGGEVASRLDSLYTYISGRLVDSNLTRDPSPLDEAIKLLSVLRDGWAQIANSPDAPPAAGR
jgi:flagellar protein FliS